MLPVPPPPQLRRPCRRAVGLERLLNLHLFYVRGRWAAYRAAAKAAPYGIANANSKIFRDRFCIAIRRLKMAYCRIARRSIYTYM